MSAAFFALVFGACSPTVLELGTATLPPGTAVGVGALAVKPAIGVGALLLVPGVATLHIVPVGGVDALLFILMLSTGSVGGVGVSLFVPCVVEFPAGPVAVCASLLVPVVTALAVGPVDGVGASLSMTAVLGWGEIGAGVFRTMWALESHVNNPNVDAGLRGHTVGLGWTW